MRDGQYEVPFTPTAEDDVRPADVSLDRACDLGELNQVEASVGTLRQAIELQLSAAPWSCRKAGQGSRTTRREL